MNRPDQTKSKGEEPKKIEARHSNKKLPLRVLLYIAGLFLLAMGVAVSVNSNLGVSPVTSLPYVISLITGTDIGIWIIVVFSGFLLLQILLRREFLWSNLLQLLFSVISGYLMDFASFLLGDFALPGYAGRMIMLFVSMVLIAAGVSLYVGTNLINMPMEGLTLAVRDKILKKLPFNEVKVITDSTVVALSVLFSFFFLSRLAGVREGTILSAILIGKIMKPVQKIFRPLLEKIS